jgi:hypothetical protein
VTRPRTRLRAWRRSRCGCPRATGSSGRRENILRAGDGGAQFSIDQIPVYVKAGTIVPMQPPMLHTGEKPVDPLIVNVWPLAPGELELLGV